MKRILYILFISIILTGCSKQPFIVEGHIDSDHDFDYTQIYLLSQTTPVQLIDSAEIRNNSFSFNVPIDSVRIGLIRSANPVNQYFLQPLMVVVESGKIQVILGKNSTGKGTPLNNTLQEWKSYKEDYNSRFREMYREYWKASSEEKDRIDSLKRQMGEEDAEYNLQLVQRNKENVLGRFIYQQMKNLFTPEQIKMLGMEEKEL